MTEDISAKIIEKENPIELKNPQGHIEFKNVSFTYPDTTKEILKNVSFKITKGETIAIVGVNGAGKSTLVKLLLRFYDANEGEILYNGINVKEYKLESLNNKIGYVYQKAVLFTGSVKDNVAYGHNGEKEPTEEDCYWHYVDGVPTVWDPNNLVNVTFKYNFDLALPDTLILTKGSNATMLPALAADGYVFIGTPMRSLLSHLPLTEHIQLTRILRFTRGS